jgi:hypothetical protein
LVTRLGSHGVDPSPSAENTKASSTNSIPFAVARASARRRCSTSRPIVVSSIATRYVRCDLVARSTGPVEPSTYARANPMAACRTSISIQRNPSTWLRRAPIDVANHR